jgi:Protein of unknown function (DUF1592)/Protein of unknown function (DUF1588)/Protein of unknown function (DUF1595)/Protein of unknown function (DUF1585)/Protein of unknown function (DUF1587)
MVMLNTPARIFGALGFAAAIALAGCGQKDDSPITKGGPVSLRRLTEPEYRQIIADVFGTTIKVPGRFEPDVRDNGLIAVGTSRESVAGTGLEQYDLTARGIATQVVDDAHRATLVPCTPAKATEKDDACATQFIARTGRLLFRRPLTQQELQTEVKDAGESATKLGNFYSGLELSVAAMLVSPQFLFRQEASEPDPDNAGQRRLDAYSKASRLSFFLWDTTPDSDLLDAAEKGDLNSDAGVAKQVDRMVKSPRLASGVRAYFTDMLGFDGFAALQKDPQIYPKYGSAVATDAQEQTLRTLADLLVTNDGDYRDIFTTRKTFLTRLLGSVYNVPVMASTGWEPHEYPDGDPRAGILTEISFVSLHSHPGRSSPTIRGKALREVFLCQKVPDPPGNVNFALVQDTKNPAFHTARARLGAHINQPTCAGCHKIMDPVGLAMENFDSSGGFRSTENDSPIDTNGEIDGMKFNDVIGFTKAVHDHPAVPSCLVNRLYSFGTGRPATKDEAEWLNYQVKQFAASGYKVPELMRRIADSKAFYRISTPGTEANNATLSMAGTGSQTEAAK